MSLKFAEELCVMTMKNDAKFGEEFPHEKINQCLTDINRCLTDIFRI